MEPAAEAREAIFQEARAAVLGRRPALAEGVSVVLMEHDEMFALRFAGERPDMLLGNLAAHFVRLVDGERTVGDIIDSMAEGKAVTEAVIAGKAAMATLHELFVDGVISELREPPAPR